MPVHFCGNFWHDAPLYVVVAIPFLTPVYVWIRHRLGRHEECDHHDH